MNTSRLEALNVLIRTVPDFPKPGILFKDITPILGNPRGYALAIDLLAELVQDLKFDMIAGPEARGFLFGAPLALKLGVGFAPIRKPGKLPWRTLEESYELEYGRDRVQMHEDALAPGQTVLLVDDLLATGGTMGACRRLAEKTGARVVAAAFLIELGFLNGRGNLPNLEIRSLLI